MSQGLPQHEAAVVETIGRELRAPAAAGVAGLVFSGLFTASLALLYRTPAKGSNAAQIATWYLQNQAKTLGVVGGDAFHRAVDNRRSRR